MGNLPGPGIEPVSPALADRFFTIEPPGKPMSLAIVLSPGMARGLWESVWHFATVAEPCTEGYNQGGS